MGQGEAFARKASGLVRELTWREAFLVSQGIQSALLWGAGSNIAFITGADPGANLVLSTFIGFLFCLPMGIVYYFLSVAMPRSGGDYIWVSRSEHPAIGYIVGWAYWISIIGLMGFGGVLMSVYCLGESFASMGYWFGSASLLNLGNGIISSTVAIFVVGFLLVIALGYVVSVFGARVLRYFMGIAFIFVMIGTAAAYWVLATSTHSDFVNAMNGFAGMTYNGILDKAKSTGWVYQPLTWYWTLQSIPFSVLVYNGFNYSAAAAGEVKNPKIGMFMGTLGALLVGVVTITPLVYLCVNVFTHEFLQAAAALYGSGNWLIIAPPYIPLFITPLVHDPITLVLIHLAWIMWMFNWAPALALVCTRYIFAFSFDRMLPGKLGEVNDRFHVPVGAWALNFAMASIFLIFTVFTGVIAMDLNLCFFWATMWFFASIVAIILPFSRYKDTAMGLPGSNWKLPLISIIGAISAVLMALTVYWSATTPSIGPSTPAAAVATTLIFVSGAAVYAIARLYNKRRGVNLGLIYAQIPPE